MNINFKDSINDKSMIYHHFLNEYLNNNFSKKINKYRDSCIEMLDIYNSDLKNNISFFNYNIDPYGLQNNISFSYNFDPYGLYININTPTKSLILHPYYLLKVYDYNICDYNKYTNPIQNKCNKTYFHLEDYYDDNGYRQWDISENPEQNDKNNKNYNSDFEYIHKEYIIKSKEFFKYRIIQLSITTMNILIYIKDDKMYLFYINLTVNNNDKKYMYPYNGIVICENINNNYL